MKVFGKQGRELWLGVGLSAGVTITMIFLYWLGGFQWLELHTYDMRMRFRGIQDITTPIIMVVIDEETTKHLGMAPNHVSRSAYGQAILSLVDAGAHLIVLDVIFSDPGLSEENHEFHQAMKRAGNVILARYIGGSQSIVPIPLLQNAALGEGLVNIRPDFDGVLRKMPFMGIGLQQNQMRPFVNIGTQAGLLHLDPEGKFDLDLQTPGLAQYGHLSFPVYQNSLLINYSGPPGTFPSIPFWKILKQKFSKEQVNGKIVLIGSTAPTLQDFHQTPFSEKVTQTLNAQDQTVTGIHMAGVEVHANVTNMILTNQFLRHSPPSVVTALMMLLGFVCLILIMLWPKGETGVVLAMLGLLGLLIVLGVYLFTHLNYWMDIVPLIAIVNGHFALATAYQRYLVVRQKNRLRAILAHYTTQETIERLWAQHSSIREKGEFPPQTLLVTTLLLRFQYSKHNLHLQHGRTGMEWVKSFIGPIRQKGIQHGGLIEGISMEGMKIHFGAPLPRSSKREIEEDAEKAIQCAWEMKSLVESLNTQWVTQGYEPVRLWITGYTGPAEGGNLGLAETAPFGLIGEAPWMANRMYRWAEEHLSEEEPFYLIIGQSTIEYKHKDWKIEAIGKIPDWETPEEINVLRIFKND